MGMLPCPWSHKVPTKGILQEQEDMIVVYFLDPITNALNQTSLSIGIGYFESTSSNLTYQYYPQINSSLNE